MTYGIHPIFSEDMKNKIISLNPSAEFVRKDGGYIFKAENTDSYGNFKCPALSEKGCILGDDKPFICRIFPYMIMELNRMKVITAARVCRNFTTVRFSELVSFP